MGRWIGFAIMLCLLSPFDRAVAWEKGRPPALDLSDDDLPPPPSSTAKTVPAKPRETAPEATSKTHVSRDARSPESEPALLLPLESQAIPETRVAAAPKPIVIADETLAGEHALVSFEWTDGWRAGAEEPYRLTPEIVESITTTGWVQVGMTALGRKQSSRFNGVLGFNDRREAQVNQTYLAIERAAVPTHEGGIGFGGRLDLLWGSDFTFVQSLGLETREDGRPKWNDHRYYGLAVPQFYVEAASERWVLRCGHFYSLVGLERVPAPENLFYSHSYMLACGEPLTFAGLLARYRLNDAWTLMLGLVNGWDQVDGRLDRGTLVAGGDWVSPSETTAVSLSLVSGEALDARGIGSQRTFLSLVARQQLTESLRYVLQHDLAVQNDGARTIPGDAVTDAEWYGLTHYLFAAINDCWTAGVRAEWFRDDDGVRVGRLRANNPHHGRFAGNFFAVTAGLNWSPHVNVAVRPELRCDRYDGPASPTGAALPFGDGRQDTQFTAAFDVVVLF